MPAGRFLVKAWASQRHFAAPGLLPYMAGQADTELSQNHQQLCLELVRQGQSTGTAGLSKQ